MNDPESKQICTRANKLFGRYFLRFEPYNLLPQNYKVYCKFCSVRSPTNTYRNNFSSCVDLLALGVIHACEWPLRNPIRPSGMFNSSAFISELTEHTESNMIIFTSGPLQSLRLFLKILHTVDKEAEMIDVH